MIRRLLATLLAVFAGLLALVPVASPAQATDYYRYWVFFTVDNGAYVASNLGVGAVTPADGSIEAFRWAAPADYEKPNLPRIDLATVTFDSVCGDTPAVDGQKRVVVLVDFGVAEDAGGAAIPEATAECSQVATDATAFQVLQKVVDVRSDNSEFGPLLCGIEGFPATGCASEKTQTATPADTGFVTVASDAPAAEDDDDNKGLLYTGLAAVVALLLGAGYFVARRAKSA